MRKRIRVKHDAGPVADYPTQQSAKDECDINKIMERHRNGGELQHINKALAQYGDFSSGLDFTQAYTAIAKAEAAFAALPAYARDYMGNDPEVFLYKCAEPDFLALMEKEGLYDPEAGPVEHTPKSPPVLESQSASGNNQSPVAGTAPEPASIAGKPPEGGAV